MIAWARQVQHNWTVPGLIDFMWTRVFLTDVLAERQVRV
jgi:hypothetical protein